MEKAQTAKNLRSADKYEAEKEHRVRNRHIEKKGQKLDVVHQFHLEVRCLKKQPQEQLELFLKKKWGQFLVRLVQEDLAKSLGRQTESDSDSD